MEGKNISFRRELLQGHRVICETGSSTVRIPNREKVFAAHRDSSKKGTIFGVPEAQAATQCSSATPGANL
jgi:hypothetical protein